MAAKTTIYFPLRANAYTLTAGAQFARFRERLKVAALLHDQLLLHNGIWVGLGGPHLNYQMHVPPELAPPERLRSQTAFERSRAIGRTFSLKISPTSRGEPIVSFGRSMTELRWEATFEPIRRELPRAYPWIDFDNFTLAVAGKDAADQIAATLQEDPLLVARYPVGFARRLIADGAAEAMVLGSAMRVNVQFDRLHAAVLATLVATGRAVPVPGSNALLATVPDVRRLEWEQVDAARRLPGLPRLRAVLADVEQAAIEAGGSAVALDDALRARFIAEAARASNEIREHAAGVLVGIATSLALAGFDPAAAAVFGPVIGAVTDMGQRLLGQERARNRWGVAAAELTAMARRTRYSPPK
jgi:hypothetical protein